MPWTFNPFSGTFDQKGSGGGAQYIDGEVATYADLPLDGSAALNSAWLVRTASGVWPVSRKQAGIYIRTATGGSNRDADYTYAGTMPDVFSDSQFLLYDNSDTSKNLAFDLGGISTGTTRTLTAPNASGRINVEGQPIGNTTPAAGTFTTLAANSGTITASAPVLDLSQTWNNAAVTFRGVNWSFVETAVGGTSEVLRISTGAAGTTAIFNIRKDGNATFANAVNVGTPAGAATIAGQDGQWRVSSGGAFGFCSSSNNAYSSMDTSLSRDAADTLAQRRLANPQTFRLYNTTDAGLANYERGFMRWSSNVLEIGSEAAGTGAARDVRLMRAGSAFIAAGATSVAASTQWVFGSTLFANGGISTTSSAVLVVNPQGNSTEFRGSAQSIRLFNARTSDTNFERLNLRWASNECIIDAEAGSGGGTLRGIKIGSATSSLLGFYGATPVDRPATVADPTGGGTVDAEARTAINDIIDRLQELGLIA